MTPTFYSYEPEDGIKFHDTAEEAKAAAEKHVSTALHYAKDSGFLDTEGDISWGQVHGRAALNEREATDYERALYENGEEIVIYDLKLEAAI